MSLRILLVAVSLSTSIFTASPISADDKTETPPVNSEPLTPVAEQDSDAITTDTADSLTETGDNPDEIDDVEIVPLRDILGDTAAIYGSFHSDVGSYDRIFQSQDDIIKASTELGTHNAEKLASGWLAYSALLASQNSQFADEVRKADAYFGRSEFIQIMNADLTYAMKLDGSQDALNKALDASKADSKRLTRIGKSLAIQSGNTLQALGWAKAKLRGDRKAFVKELEDASKEGRPIFADMQTLFDVSSLNEAIIRADTLSGKSSLWDNLLTTDTQTETEFKLPTFDGTGFTTFTPFSRRKPKYDFLNGRITTLAALRILNETDELSPELTRALTDKEVTGGVSLTSCLKMSQLQYFTCVEGNQFVYERAFCIGEHAVTDVGRCLDKFAN